MTDLAGDDLEFIDRVRGIAEQLTDADHVLEAPPPDLWDRIERAAAEEAGSLVAVPPGDPEPEPAEVISLESHARFRRVMPLLAVAAAVVAVVAAAAVLIDRTGTDSTVIAGAVMVNDGLQVANPDSGFAELREVDGQLVLAVDVPTLPDEDGFFELWVIDADVAGMHSLGVVTGDGEFALPTGIDPAAFPVVDISVEPADGDPTHSGQSIWRGVLDV